MPTSGFDVMPIAGAVYPAYRPVYFVLQVNGVTSGAPPAAYLDIYFNGVFYKTLSKTQPRQVSGSTYLFEFDIQDAAQEYLRIMIAPLYGLAIVTGTPPLTVECQCKGRGSDFDDQGYILPDGPVPIQATGDIPATGGGGEASNTFTIVNAALQHEDDAVTSATYGAKYNEISNTRDGTTFPLTHRAARYKICLGDSDYFPIISLNAPAGLRLHYRLKTSPDFSEETSDIICIPVGPIAATLPNAAVGAPYSVSIPLTGSGPFTIDSSEIPAWMSAVIDGGYLVLTGTPGSGDAGTGFGVSVVVTNCGGGSSAPLFDTIDVITCIAVTVPAYAFPDARAGTPYFYAITLSGDAPFILDGNSVPAWMSVAIVGSQIQFYGTPTDGDVDTGVTVSADVCNCTGLHCAPTISDTIDVLASNNFELSASFNFRIDGVTGDGAPVSNGPTTVNGRKFTHHADMAGGSYFVTITGTIVTTTSLNVTVNGIVQDCVLIGTVVGTAISGITYELVISGAVTEDQDVRFAIIGGNC